MFVKDIEDCDDCPFKREDLCTGSPDGPPEYWEPFCATLNKGDLVDDILEREFNSFNSAHEESISSWNERQIKERKNKISLERRRYLRNYCVSERVYLKQERNRLNSYLAAKRFANSMAEAFSTVSSFCSRSTQSDLSNEIDSTDADLIVLQSRVEEAEKILKLKQAECRKTEKYMNMPKYVDKKYGYSVGNFKI